MQLFYIIPLTMGLIHGINYLVYSKTL